MGLVDTILFLSLSTQRLDDVVEIAHSTHNFIWAEITMEEFGQSSFLLDGAVNEQKIFHGDVGRAPPTIIP
jgi:hypothetical protein